MATFHLSIKSGKKGTAAEHAAYITREGKHGKDGKGEDLVATGFGNLPPWANNNPKNFFAMADKHERANAAVYREFEVALPNELPESQQVELVETYIGLIAPGKPSLFAIHLPSAAIGGVAQGHAHIMFSDRLSDGVDRPPSQHFSRYNAAHPEKGGCRKDSGGKDWAALRNEVTGYRKEWAELQNQFLERNGQSVRVDHRSHRERGIDVPPERHLGPAKVRQLTDEEKQAIRVQRKANRRTNS